MSNQAFEIEREKKEEQKLKKIRLAVAVFIGLVSVMSIIFSILTIIYGFYHLKDKY